MVLARPPLHVVAAIVLVATVGLAASCSSSSGGAGQACHSDSECGIPNELAYCYTGGLGGCPIAVEDTCQTDSDCANAGSNSICGGMCCGDAGLNSACVYASLCSVSQCGPKCTSDSDCVPTWPAGGLSCLANGHCAPKTCSASTDCAPNYVCRGQTCVVKPCTMDSQCSGACVNGACAAQVGKCEGEEF